MTFLHSHVHRLSDTLVPRQTSSATNLALRATPQLSQSTRGLVNFRRAVLLSTQAATVDAPPKTSPPSTAKGNKLIAPEVAQDLYKDMKLGREFEEMCAFPTYSTCSSYFTLKVEKHRLFFECKPRTLRSSS